MVAEQWTWSRERKSTKLAVLAAGCLTLAGTVCGVNGFILTHKAYTFAMATHGTQVMSGGAALLLAGSGLCFVASGLAKR